MSRASAALPAVAILLGACAATESLPSAQPFRAGQSQPIPSAAAETTEDICVGPNAQVLDIDEPARSYGRAWNELDYDARLALLERVWTEDGTLAEPSLPNRLSGLQAVADRIGDFHATRPGEYFEWQADDLPDMHHQRLRMPWRLCDAAGTTLLEGTDFMVLTADSRIADVTTFHPPE